MTERTADRDAILLACSGLAASRSAGVEPLGPKGWASLAERSRAAGLAPGELVTMSPGELETRLMVTTDAADRLARLFARHSQLTFELERIERLGIWVSTVDEVDYPGPLRDRLGAAAPPVIFGLGDRGLSTADSLAVVGSRDSDPDALQFAREAGQQAARQGWAIVSGAARGVDAEAMRGAFDTGGRMVGVTADGLERHLRDASLRTAFASGQAAYMSTYRPDAPFSVGAAMGRNKLIYCLARAGVVVHATANSGGTWAGAVEALQAGWVPVFVNAGSKTGGNTALIRRGGRPVRSADLADLAALVAESDGPVAAVDQKQPVTQQTLF